MYFRMTLTAYTPSKIRFRHMHFLCFRVYFLIINIINRKKEEMTKTN